MNKQTSHRSVQRVVAAVAFSALLPLAAVAADAPTPVAVDASFNVADVAASGFKIADNKALKGISRVAVPVFVVDFVTADNVRTQTSGFRSEEHTSELQSPC